MSTLISTKTPLSLEPQTYSDDFLLLPQRKSQPKQVGLRELIVQRKKQSEQRRKEQRNKRVPKVHCGHFQLPSALPHMRNDLMMREALMQLIPPEPFLTLMERQREYLDYVHDWYVDNTEYYIGFLFGEVVWSWSEEDLDLFDSCSFDFYRRVTSDGWFTYDPSDYTQATPYELYAMERELQQNLYGNEKELLIKFLDEENIHDLDGELFDSLWRYIRATPTTHSISAFLSEMVEFVVNNARGGLAACIDFVTANFHVMVKGLKKIINAVKAIFQNTKKIVMTMLNPNLFTLIGMLVVYLAFEAVGLDIVGRLLVTTMAATMLEGEESSYLKLICAVWATYGVARKFASGNVYVTNNVSIPTVHANVQNVLSPTVMLCSLVCSALLGLTSFGLELPAYKEFAQKMDSHLKVFRGLTYFTSGIGSVFEMVLSYMGFEYCGFVVEDESSLPEDVMQIVDMVRGMTVVRRQQLANNEEDCKLIVRMFDQMNECRLKYRSNRIIMSVMDKFQAHVISLYSRVVAIFPAAVKDRIEPVVVMLYGDSGVGKSTLLYHLGAVVLNHLGLIRSEMSDKQVEDEIAKCIYARMIEMEYWDAYNSQPVTMLDDFAQMKDSTSNPNLEFMELVRMSNPFPYPLHMAQAENKGNFTFQSRVVIGTTNLKHLKPSSLVSVEAVERRIDMPFAVTIKPQYADAKGRLAVEHRTGDINVEVYEFQPWHTTTGVIAGPKIGFKELCRQLVNRMFEKSHKHERQRLSVVSFARSLMSPTTKNELGLTQHTQPEAVVTHGVQDESESEEEDENIAGIILPRTQGLFSWFRAQPVELTETDKAFMTYAEDAYSRFQLSSCPMSNAGVAEWLAEQQSVSVFLDSWLRMRISGVSADETAQRLLLENAGTRSREPWDQSFAEFMLEHENKFKIVCKMATLVGLLFTGFAVYKQWKKGQSSLWDGAALGLSTVSAINVMTESGKDRARVMVRPRIEQIPTTEGWRSDNARDVSRIVKKNIRWMYLGGMIYPINILMLKNRIAAINTHYVEFMQENMKQDPEIEVTLCSPGEIEGVVLKWRELHFTQYFRGEERTDMTLVMFPRFVNRASDIMSHMMRKEDLSAVIGLAAVMVVPTKDSDKTWAWHQNQGKVVEIVTTEYTDNGNKTLVGNAIVCDFISTAGDCGGVYVLDSPCAARRVVGIHFAGFTGVSYGVPLVYEDIIRALSEEMRSEFDISLGLNQVETLNMENECPMVHGNSQAIGKIDQRLTPRHAIGTKLVKTKVFDKITPSEMAPAYLEATFERGGIMSRAIDKQFGPNEMVDDKFLDIAVKDYEKMLSRFPVRADDMVVFDDVTAIKGKEGSDYIKGINRKRSAGYPWCLKTRKGKTEYFGKDQWDITGKKAMEVRNKIQRDVKKMEQGEQVPYIFIDTLKDETRSKEKIAAKKTRVFSAAPMDFVIVFRMYFLAFMVWMMENRVRNESAVGIKAQSDEWDVLARKILSKGNNVVAGDFSNYDGTLNSRILWRILDVIENFYKLNCGWKQEDANVRRALWEHVVCSYHLVGDQIYQLNHSQPSGNPSTAVLNTMYNCISMRYVFYQAAPFNTSFCDNVAMVAYGDDNVLSVSNTVAKWFNQETITIGYKAIGMTYTDEEKTGLLSGFRKLEDVSFLKRGFVRDNQVCLWLAPLKMSSILECFNWIQKTEDEAGVMGQNASMAFAELALHDEATYVEYVARIRQTLAKYYGINTVDEGIRRYRTLLKDGILCSMIPELNWA